MNQSETLSGGKSVNITLKNGVIETVFIRELPVFGDSYRRYALSLANQDLMEELKLYTLKKDGWFKEIDQASARKLRDLGREVNDHFFRQALEDQNPALTTVMKKMEKELKSIADIRDQLDISSAASSDSDSPNSSSLIAASGG